MTTLLIGIVIGLVGGYFIFRKNPVAKLEAKVTDTVTKIKSDLP